MRLTKEIVYTARFDANHYILAGDIGGTNSNFGIISWNASGPRLLGVFQAKSQEITDYPAFIKTFVSYLKDTYNITFSEGCFGAAGIVSENRRFVSPTNLSVSLDANELARAAGIGSLWFINDFEAVGLGIDYIAPENVITINRGTTRLGAHKASVGAGTGLGKVALLWHHHAHAYLPLASEGGHEDAAAQTEKDMAFFECIKKVLNHDCPISWENILSGNGIPLIYQYLSSKQEYPESAVSKEIRETRFQPDLISRYAQQDELCRDTFLYYAQWYARCAKNFTLDVLALNGIYIAGGIAAKNISVFQHPIFMQEFIKCGRHSELLKKVPVYVIADYNVSLYGAAAYIEYRHKEIMK
jgi:glucokinase